MESIKHRWYEGETQVVVDVPVKNVTEENLSVSFAPDTLNINLKLPNGETYNQSLNLFHPIVPDKCSYKILQTKVEIHLPKVMHSRWGQLEKEEQQPVAACASSQTKNWDKVVKENLTEKEEESVDQLFSKIYADGNDDQKRAMLKSFSESGGTVLSTNWSEVAKKKVDIKPPDGVEFKPWS